METEYTVFLANRGTPIVFRVLTTNATATNALLAATTGRIVINTLPTGSGTNLDGTIARTYQFRIVPT